MFSEFHDTSPATPGKHKEHDFECSMKEVVKEKKRLTRQPEEISWQPAPERLLGN